LGKAQPPNGNERGSGPKNEKVTGEDPMDTQVSKGGTVTR